MHRRGSLAVCVVLGLVSWMATPALAARSVGSANIDYGSGTFEIDVEKAMLPDVLRDIQETARVAGLEVSFEVVGDANVPVSVRARERGLSLLVNTVVRAAGLFPVQRGTRFTLYGDGAADLSERPITYTHNLRHLPVETAVQILKGSGSEKVAMTGVPETSTVAVTGPLGDVKQAVLFLEALDGESRVVLIELLVVEYKHSKGYQFGIDVTKGQLGKFSGVSIAPGQKPSGTFSYNFVGALDPAFTANLTSLISRDRARVVTNPHVAVRNGTQAKIELKEERYVSLQQSRDQTGFITYDLRKLDAGVTLDVTPTITYDGTILLKVAGELGVFLPSVPPDYQIDRSTVDTCVNVHDGDTLIIGGLIKRHETDNTGGIPLLRDIPLVGGLFKTQTKETSQTETVLYITPHIYPLRDYRSLGGRDEVRHMLRQMELNYDSAGRAMRGK